MGLLKTAAKVAVASSVHGRVQRRQQSRWAAQDQAAAQAATSASSAPHPPPPAAAATSGNDTNELLAQLKQLGELRDAGVLTDNEFQAQKARILARQG
jgi:hypothetical protein